MGTPSERRVDGSLTVDLCLLTWTSGVFDALSYLRARVFTANMTGNTVVLGLAIVGSDRWRAFDCAAAICAFAFGALICGALLLQAKSGEEKNLRSGLLLEAPFALVFSALWAFTPSTAGPWLVAALIVSSACALGIQSVVVRHLKISGVATTFITGTITTAVLAALESYAPSHAGPKERRGSPWLLAGIFVLYILAAMSGAALAAAKYSLAPLPALAALFIVLFRSR